MAREQSPIPISRGSSRTFSSYMTLTPPSAIVLTLIAPLNSGGPQVFIWGWVIVCVFTLPVALSLAEISSEFVTAGGPSDWAFRISSPRYKRIVSWYTGYLNLGGLSRVILSPERPLILAPFFHSQEDNGPLRPPRFFSRPFSFWRWRLYTIHLTSPKHGIMSSFHFSSLFYSLS